MASIYIALYAPSSVQKLLDFLKTVYVGNAIPVVIKPYGAAAQVGIPEAHKVAYKQGKPLIVLPEIKDLSNVVGCDCVYYITEEGREVDLQELVSPSSCRKPALVICSSEQEPSKKELEGVEPIWIADIPRGIPATALTGILIYKLVRINISKQG